MLVLLIHHPIWQSNGRLALCNNITFIHLTDAFTKVTYRSVRLYILFYFFQYVCSLGIEPTTFCAANAMLYHWATGTVSRSICAGIVFGRNAVLETGQILRWVNYSVMTLFDLNKPFYILYIHWLSPRGRSSSESLVTSIIFKTVESVFCVFVSILTI